MLTTFDESHLVASAIQAGASGYLLKDAPVETIVDAITSSTEGSLLISAKAAASLGESVVSGAAADDASSAQQRMNALSPREQEVFFLMVRGRDNATIARELCISERTVRNHVSRIYDVIGVHNRTQALLWAQSQQISFTYLPEEE